MRLDPSGKSRATGTLAAGGFDVVFIWLELTANVQPKSLETSSSSSRRRRGERRSEGQRPSGQRGGGARSAPSRRSHGSWRTVPPIRTGIVAAS
jgi:hypothetical protein